MTEIRILVERTEGVFVATARDEVGVIGVSQAPTRCLAVNPLRRKLMESISGPVRIVEEEFGNDKA